MASLGGLDHGFGTHVHIADDLGSHLTVVLGGILFVLAITRILSGQLYASRKTPDGDTVPVVPYWIPFIGHAPQFFFLRTWFFQWTRKAYRRGAFAINLGGSVHNIIFKPSLGHALMNQRHEIANSDFATRYIMCAVYGWPKDQMDVYDKAISDVADCYKALSAAPGLPKLINGTTIELRRNINNLVTFCNSPVDQMTWERCAGVNIETNAEGEMVEEVSLLSLSRNFIASSANVPLFGSDFMNNNPEVWQDLWQLDDGFMWLASQLPGWLPIAGLMRASFAKRRLLRRAEAFEVALDKWAQDLDPGMEWSNLEDVSELLKARIKVYRKHNLSIRARASVEVALAWAMNANANPLIFWVLCRVYSDPKLLEDIRQEVRPYIKIQHPDQGLAIAGQPSLADIDHEGLNEKCPLLKAAYIGSLRLDTAVWSLKRMKQDCTLSTKEQGSDKFLLKKGDFCHVAHELHHLNSEYYEEPDVWRVGRHLKYEAGEDGTENVAKADIGNVRSYGGGHSMCKGRHFAVKEILMFSAAIFTFWDMEPASGGKWKIPSPARKPGTNGVAKDIRVKIKRRTIPMTKP